MHQDLHLIVLMHGGKSNPTTFADGERARSSIYFSRYNIKCDECHSRRNYNLHRRGKLFKDLIGMNILKYIDILVDGPYIQELKKENLKYRGSSNQRIIDVQKSLKENKIIIYME